MPPSLEPLFEFLFKYRPVVFEKGRLALSAPWPLTLMLGVAAVIAVPALLTYRSARGKSRPFDRALLTGLRITAVLLVLTCLLRPVLLLQTVVPQQSFVGVLLDDSMSLRIADQGGAARSAFVQRTFGSPESALLRSLRERFKLRFFRFSSSLDRLPRVEDLAFSGTGTDLAAALAGAREELAGVPLSGLVLVTDGADNGRGALSETLLMLKAKNVPVFPIGLGRERFDRDIDLSRVEAPRAVLKGTSFVASVWLSARGYRGRAQVLVEDAGRVVHTEEVELPSEGEARPVRVHVTASEPGPRLLRFRIARRDGEQVTQNNQQDVLVQVDDRREKILYFEGELRFEPKFLRRAVADDRNLQVVTLLRTAKNKFLRLDVDDPEELAAGFPKTREELYRYRGLILGSVEASFFTGDQLRMLADFVSQRGGGLLTLGGAHSFGEGGYADTPLADALPVVLEPPAAKPGQPYFASLKVELTPFGVTHGAIQIAASEEETAKRWRTLPAVSALNPISRSKPGAATLVAGKPEGPGQPQVVLAHQRYGRGKSIAFTVQDSWQWQMNPAMALEDMTHENLCRQLLRWLVSGVPGAVTVKLPEDRVAPGSRVVVRAEVDDDRYLKVNNAQVVAHLKEPSGQIRELPMEWAVEKDGEYRASFPATDKGLYELRVEARRGGQTLGSETAYAQVADLDAEFHGAEMHASLLKRIASETGGRFYTPDTASGLAEDLRYTEGGASVLEQKDLWDMPALYLLTIALVSAEWGYRKRRGLA